VLVDVDEAITLHQCTRMHDPLDLELAARADTSACTVFFK